MIGALFGFFAQTKTGRLMAVFLCAVAALGAAYLMGGAHQRLSDRAARLEAAQKINQERTRDDTKLRALDDDRLCLEYFRHSDRLSDLQDCRTLRGLYSE